MIGPIPQFLLGEHLQRKEIAPGYEHDVLTEEATEDEKKEFEEYYNTPYDLPDYRSINPDMEEPYLKWNGEFVEKPAETPYS